MILKDWQADLDDAGNGSECGGDAKNMVHIFWEEREEAFDQTKNSRTWEPEETRSS